MITRDIAESGQFPIEARRLQPTANSGWILPGGKGDAGDLRPALVDDLIARFRILDSILDEPVGTAWRWNDERLEYIRIRASNEPQPQPMKPDGSHALPRFRYHPRQRRAVQGRALVASPRVHRTDAGRIDELHREPCQIKCHQ